MAILRQFFFFLIKIEIVFVKLYHDVLEAGGGVIGQSHQKLLKGLQN